jgi:hypothetical protein
LNCTSDFVHLYAPFVLLPEGLAKETTVRAIEILPELGPYLSIQYTSTIRFRLRNVLMLASEGQVDI